MGRFSKSETVRMLQEIIGRDATENLLKAAGGTRVYIPAKLPDEHWLIEAIGLSAAKTLSLELSVQGRRGAELNLPLGSNTTTERLRALIVDLHKKKHSANQIALRLGITDRTVRAHKSALGLSEKARKHR
jgi:DNA-binding NarL/FixJ family response regulator